MEIRARSTQWIMAARFAYAPFTMAFKSRCRPAAHSLRPCCSALLLPAHTCITFFRGDVVPHQPTWGWSLPLPQTTGACGNATAVRHRSRLLRRCAWGGAGYRVCGGMEVRVCDVCSRSRSEQHNANWQTNPPSHTLPLGPSNPLKYTGAMISAPVYPRQCVGGSGPRE